MGKNGVKLAFYEQNKFNGKAVINWKRILDQLQEYAFGIEKRIFPQGALDGGLVSRSYRGSLAKMPPKG